MGKKDNLELITLNQCFIYNKNLLENNEDFECSVYENSILYSKSNLYMTNDYLIILSDYGKNKKLKTKIYFDE